VDNSVKILHISHHLGCFKDQEYILNKLGYKVTNLKFYDRVFTITKDIADSFWKEKKEELNSYDYILTSDTAPLSRIFLENQNEFKSKLIIWICNRFDYNMEKETDFYKLFSKAEENKNIKIIPYTHFEKVWCEHKGIILKNDTIRPNGNTIGDHDLNIPNINFYKNEYRATEELPDADVIVPIYYNDNIYFKLSDYLRNKNIKVYNGGFISLHQLKKYKGFVTLPDAFSKFLAFELIHAGIPAILPSKKFLFDLSRTSGYFFNIWGSGGATLLQPEMIDWCEWYDPRLKKCRFYFDAFDEIPDIVNNINVNTMKENFINASNILEQDSLNNWNKLYNTF
jgi:hypothetical protein